MSLMHFRARHGALTCRGIPLGSFRRSPLCSSAAVSSARPLALPIPWNELGSLPGQVAHYLGLMFAAPDWEMLPQALFETWRSISMAWIGAIGCVVVSIPLGMLAAQGSDHSGCVCRCADCSR